MFTSPTNHFGGVTGSALSQLQTAFIVAPSFILYGYTQAGLGGLIKLQDWVKTFPEIDTVHTEGEEKSKKATLQGFTVAIFVIGAVFGSLTCSWAGDRFGRRHCIFVAATLTLIGLILETSAFHLAQFLVGRTVLGFAVGSKSLKP
jgi:MFS family permease